MLVEQSRPTNPPVVPESEFDRTKRLEKLASERQNAFQSEKAQKYWDLDRERLVSYWQDFVASTVPDCPFSEEELSGFRNEEIPLFVPKRQGKDWVAKLGQSFQEPNPEKAINGYSFKDTGPSGIWVAMKATVDPPYPAIDKPGIEAVMEKNNFKTEEGKRKENLEVLKLIPVGIEGYLWFAKLVKELTEITIDSVDEPNKQFSRLLASAVGGREAAAVRLNNNELEILWGLADSCSSGYVGWRLARVSRNLTKGFKAN